MSFRDQPIEKRIEDLESKIENLQVVVEALTSSENDLGDNEFFKDLSKETIVLLFDNVKRTINPWTYGLDSCPSCDERRYKNYSLWWGPPLKDSCYFKGENVSLNNKSVEYMEKYLIGDPIVLRRRCIKCDYTWYVHKNERKT